MANLDQIVCVASLGCGKGCIRFWGRLDQNCSFHGNRKPPLTYNGENDVYHFLVVFNPILFIFLGNKDMHKISDVLPQNKNRSLRPIFHGSVILPYILKTI